MRYYLPYDEAQKEIAGLNIKSESAWRLYSKTNRPQYIPSLPCRFYKGKGWVSWGEWLGNNHVKYGKVNMMTYEKAHRKVLLLAKKNKIFTQFMWRRNAASILRGYKIPLAPDIFYKGKGWVSWGEWLGSHERNNKRKYKVNESFFKKWSHDMAYILGFWFADGNMNKNGNTFSFCQHSDDKYLLELFRHKMETDHNLRKQKECFVLEIFSKKMVSDIISLGGKPHKSLDVKFPLVPLKYISSFVRGYFDGDGGLMYDKKTNVIQVE